MSDNTYAQCPIDGTILTVLSSEGKGNLQLPVPSD